MRVNQKITYPGVGKPRKISENLGVCHLKGSHREVGFQYGKAFSEDLVDFNGYLKSLLAESAGKFLSKLVYYVVLPFYSLLQWCRIPKPLRQEMKGIAEGAEDLSRFNTIRLMKMVRLSSLYDFMVNFAMVGVGCSSFAQRGEDGKLIIGRNFDFNYDPLKTLERSQIILYEIEGQQPFLSTGPIFFNAAPTTAIIKGENGEPLFFAIHNVIGPRKFFGKPTFTLLREMTNQASFEDLQQLLHSSKETCAKKFLFADSRQAAVADAVPDKEISIDELEEDGSHIEVTNHYQTKRSKKFESETERDHGLNFNSRVRLYSLRGFLKKVTEPSLEAAIAALSNIYDYTRKVLHPWGDVISPPFNNDQRPPYKVNIARTYYSTVLDHKNGMLWVAGGEYAPHTDFHGIKLGDFWDWTKIGKKLEIKIYPQVTDYQILELGRKLTEAICQAKYYYKKDNFGKAYIHLNKVLRIDPDHIEAHLLLASIGLENLNLPRFFDINSQDPNIAYNSTGMANVFDDLNKIIDIENRHEVLPKFRRGSAFAHLLLGIGHDLRGEREDAVANYQKVLTLKKENEFGAEAAEWATEYLNEPCRILPCHETLATIIL